MRAQMHKRKNLGSNIFTDGDASSLSTAVGDFCERHGKSGIKVRFLLRKELQQDGICRGNTGSFRRGAGRSRYLEPIGGIAAFDGIDGVEHSSVHDSDSSRRSGREFFCLS